MSAEARGWAAVENGEVDVRSVQDSRVGAMVNWMVGNGCFVGRRVPDDLVEFLFANAVSARDRKVRIVEVVITAMEH